MTIKFDTKTCKAVGAEIAAAVQQIAQKHGVSIEYGGGSIKSDVEFMLKLRLLVTDPKATEAAERAEFAMLCYAYDLKPEHYGAKIKLASGEATLIGFAPRRDRMPIKVRRADGKLAVTTEAAVKHLVAKRPDDMPPLKIQHLV